MTASEEKPIDYRTVAEMVDFGHMVAFSRSLVSAK